jgi:hypothetical protein
MRGRAPLRSALVGALLVLLSAAASETLHAPRAERGPDVYFHNRVTGEVSWEDPGTLAPYTHSPSGRFYWEDLSTGETTWEAR